MRMISLYLPLLLFTQFLTAGSDNDLWVGYIAKLITGSGSSDIDNAFDQADLSEISIKSMLKPTPKMQKANFALNDEQAENFITLAKKAIAASAKDDIFSLVFDRSYLVYPRHPKILHFILSNRYLTDNNSASFLRPMITDFLKRSIDDSFLTQILFLIRKFPSHLGRPPIELLFSRNNPLTLTILLAKTKLDVNKFDFVLKLHCRPYVCEQTQIDSAFKQAILEDDAQSVAIMLQHGADPFVRDWQGKDAFFWVQRCRENYQEIKDLLEQYQRPIDIKVNISKKIGNNLKWFFTGSWFKDLLKPTHQEVFSEPN